MYVDPRDETYLKDSLDHLDKYRSINIYHFLLKRFKDDYRQVDGSLNEGEFRSMVNRIRTYLLESSEFIEDSVLTNGYFRIRYNPNFEHDKTLKKYSRQQRNTAYAVGAFTAITTLFGVLTYVKSCEKEPIQELQVSPNILLQLDSSLLVQKLTDSSLRIKVAEHPKKSFDDSLPHK